MIYTFERNYYSQAEVTDCGKYLIVTTGRDCQYNMVFFCDLTEKSINGKLDLTPVVDKMEADYDVKKNPF